MANASTIYALPAVSGLPAATLAAVLDQSADCVKLVGPEGEVRYMNPHGLRAMEIDDFRAVEGRPLIDMWPQNERQLIVDAYRQASAGQTVRFRAFCPTLKGSPRWWDETVIAVTDSSGALAGYLLVSRDATENEEIREALEVAASEITHRLKNTYAMIGSLLIGFAKGNLENERFAQEMSGRLVGLSAAQLLFVSNEAPLHLDQLIPTLISPFDRPSCPVSIDQMPAMIVDQSQANAIALVIGELAVNSAKHGALCFGGSVDVTSAEKDGDLTILWIERSNQSVKAHDRTGGQGMRLMERVVRARRGSILYEWEHSGLSVTLTFHTAAAAA